MGGCIVKFDKEISKIDAWKKNCLAIFFSVKKYWAQRRCWRKFVLDTTGEKITDGRDVKQSGGGKQRKNLAEDRSRSIPTVSLAPSIIVPAATEIK